LKNGPDNAAAGYPNNLNQGMQAMIYAAWHNAKETTNDLAGTRKGLLAALCGNPSS
jgi:hypothetical protein